MLLNIKKEDLNICLEENVSKLLIVCSHERSGTHFLMNSISNNSNYTVKPFLNFDTMPLGDIVNFYKKKSVQQFLIKFSDINIKDKKYCLSSIVKTHHDSSFFENLFGNQNVSFLYIYRNPLDTLISFWRFMHNWEWNEGPKENNPLKFVQSTPEGQMMRYQKTTYNTILDRWANHVSEWYKASKKTNNILLINYRELNESYENTLSLIFKFLKLEQQSLLRPTGDFIKSKDLSLSKEIILDLKKYINTNITKYSIIQNNIKF